MDYWTRKIPQDRIKKGKRPWEKRERENLEARLAHSRLTTRLRKRTHEQKETISQLRVLRSSPNSDLTWTPHGSLDLSIEKSDRLQILLPRFRCRIQAGVLVTLASMHVLRTF